MVKDMFGKEYKLEDMLACVGDGWKDIVTELYNLCDQHNVEVHQVKEKFGGLRFYVGEAPIEVFDAIEEAENKSETICEYCGAPGKIRGGGWIKTLCDDCVGSKK